MTTKRLQIPSALRQLFNTAYHEGGHAMAYILLNKKFRYVTIKSEGDKNMFGHIMPYRSQNYARLRELYSFFDPVDFFMHFEHDFITLAGPIAEKIFAGKFSHIGANGDYNNWIDITLLDLPEKLNFKYQKFLIEYIIEVFSIGRNWDAINFIAEALIEKETLSYKQVMEELYKRFSQQ